jgi:parallel beta-helix repeat protein
MVGMGLPSAAQAATFTPVADTYVDSAAPTANNGSKTILRTDASPIINSYIRFGVQGVPAGSSAKLRVFASSSNSVGFRLHTVSDNSWSEGINYNNAPAIGAAIGSSGKVTAGTWYEFDVSAYVTGDGPVSFALTSASTTATSYSSREGANPPQLVAPTPAPATSFDVTRAGTTYTAQSPSGQSFTGTLKAVVESAVGVLKSSGGGTITFGAGDFDLGGSWWEFYDLVNIRFLGQGMDATTIRNNSSASTDTEPFDISTASNVVIRDLTINAGGPFRSTSDAIDFDGGNDSLVERVKVTGARGRGIVFDGKDIVSGLVRSAERNTIRNCIVTGVPSDGIELLAASNNRVESCSVTNVGGHGIQMTKGSPSAGQPNKPSSGNVITGNSVDNSGQDGININAGDGNQLLGNTVLNSSDDVSGKDGIRVGTSDSVSCNDTVVSNNTSSDNQAVHTQRYGLHIASNLCNRTVVSGNTFSGNLTAPIRDLGTNTQYPSGGGGGGDSTPPSVPQGVSATAVSGTRVDVAWQASTDDTGVTGYSIFRDGALLATTDGAARSYQDTTVSPGTTYSYTVEAFDAAGNRSERSAPASVTTPSGGGGTVTLTAQADAYVKSDTPNSTYGTTSALRTDASPETRSYLRFDLSGLGSATRAVLRVYANSSNAIGYDVRGVADTSWSESGLNFTNAPPVGAIAGSSGPVAGGSWTEVDVTSLVAGNGLLSLAMTSTSSTATGFASREAGGNAPQLVVTTSG